MKRQGTHLHRCKLKRAEKPCSEEISLGEVATDAVQALHAKPRMAVARGQKQRCVERCG